MRRFELTRSKSVCKSWNSSQIRTLDDDEPDAEAEDVSGDLEDMVLVCMLISSSNMCKEEKCN